MSLYHGPAVNGDGSVLTELFLGFVHLTDEVNESFAGLRDTLFRPISELELTHSPRLTVLYTMIAASVCQE